MLPRYVILLGALALLGAGCAKSSPMSPVTPPPLQTIPTPATSTAQAVPEGWQTATGLLGGFSLSYPGQVLSGEQNMVTSSRERLLTVDIGTAVEAPGEKSVPRRTLYVDRLIPGDEYYQTPCVTTSTSLGLQTASSTTVSSGAVLCVRAFTDAAAGNLYHSQEAALFTMRGGFVVGQTVHSVQCTNFERPDEQCVPYDEARDTALFEQILQTLR